MKRMKTDRDSAGDFLLVFILGLKYNCKTVYINNKTGGGD